MKFVTFTRARRGLINKARRGIVALEMALISPVFFLMLIGLVELSLIVTAQQMLESAAFNASRLAKTGYTTTGSTQQATVLALLNQEIQSFGTMLDPNKLTITYTAYNSFAGIGVNGQGTAGLGGPQQIVVYKINYPWPLFTPLLGTMMGDHGTLNLTTQIVVRNEPY